MALQVRGAAVAPVIEERPQWPMIVRSSVAIEGRFVTAAYAAKADSLSPSVVLQPRGYQARCEQRLLSR
jgi:hypothetical protein